MKKQPTEKKITVFGLFFKALAKYPALAAGALGANVIALALYTLIPWYYKNFFDALSSGQPKEQAAAAAIGIIIVIAGLNAVRWVFRRLSEYLVCRLQPLFMQDMTLYCFSRVLNQPYQFFANNFSGSLMRKIQRLAQAFENIDDIIQYTISTMVITTVGSLWLIGLRSLALMGIFAAWIVVILIFNIFVSKWLRKIRLQRAAKDSETAGVLSDALGNSTNIKLFSSDRHEFDLLNKVTTDLRKLRQTSWNRQNDSIYAQVALIMVVEFLTIYWCVISWKAGTITLGDIVLAQSILLKLGDMIWNLNNIFRNFYESYADAQEMVDILNLPAEVTDAPNAKTLKVSHGGMIFDQVQFNYNETREILKDFSLNIRPKEKIALVGPSGAGKSTVVKLIFRLYDLTAGQILIDGQDISKVTQASLHDNLAMVPQEPLLFHRSLRDNIRYGRLEATDAEVEAAAKKAHCHEFIAALPKGYDTLVGERGIKLSGGERQRVAIARAILKNTPILVLDEATSSLDSESELLIRDALKELMKDKTVIVIAHRLSTIMEMDRIVVVEDGRITDAGTHEELLKRAGTYQKLWEIQAGGFIA